jgi:hypothetical protein
MSIRMAAQQSSLRGALEATSSTILGLITIAGGLWTLFLTDAFGASIAAVIAGAIAFPPTRGIVTFGRLRVGRWLHDAISFFLYILWLVIALFIAQPWA